MEVDGKEYLFPTIREVNGKLKKLSNQAALKEAMRKKDFLVFEGKDKKERIAKATEVSKIISNLVMPTRDTRMKKFPGGNADSFNEERFLKHLQDREGTSDYIYLDTLDKPTGGTGHLLLKDELKNYDIAEYKTFNIPNIGKRKVAFDSSGNPIKLDNATTTNWLKEDSKRAIEAARKQANDFNVSSGEFIEALSSVNFQLGTNWTRKFPSAVQALKDKDYKEAIKQIQSGRSPGSVSDWKKQTPVRVEDFAKAIKKLIK